MPDFAALLAEDRRLIILRALAEDHDYALNDSVLKRALASLGHEVSRDMLRADLAWLKDHRLTTLRELDDGVIWVARATEDGVDVARGRPHPGVARPLPGH
jgi:DNA-binding transcriptional ArsR family regulator